MNIEAPIYVSLDGTTLRLKSDSEYWRDAGLWGVGFRFDEDSEKWYSVCDDPDIHWLDNVELIPVTKEEYETDNRGYL